MPDEPVLSQGELKDLEAAMGLIRGAIDSRSLSASVLESHLGWSEGKIEEWLEKPYEARVVDYLRLMRLATSRDLERPSPGAAGVSSDPDLLDNFFHVSPYRSGSRAGDTSLVREPAGEAKPPGGQPLRVLDLVVNALLASVLARRLSASEVLESILFYERLLREAMRRAEEAARHRGDPADS